MKKTIDPKAFEVSAFKAIGNDWFLITSGNGEKVNAMTAQWGGFGYMWGKNVAYVVIRPSRYTKEFVDETGRFSLSFLPPEQYKKHMTYLGTVSGRDEDKINVSGLQLTKIDGFPCFKEARYVMLCKTLYKQEMEESCFLDHSIVKHMYPDKDFHTLYVAEVEKILVEE